MQIEITTEYLASQGLSKTFPDRFWKKVSKDGKSPRHCPELGLCWKWNKGCNALGYGTLGAKGTVKILAHRGSWILNRGPIPHGMNVLHKCDNPPCTNPDHLWLGTFAENVIDMMAKGRHRALKGDENPNAFISREIIQDIAREYSTKHTPQYQLAKQFGVSKGTVYNAIYGLHYHSQAVPDHFHRE